MRFSVDAWDPGYGTSLDEGVVHGRSTARVTLDVERGPDDWKPIDPTPVTPPSAVLFVDGVRRVDAQLWVHDRTEDGTTARTASQGLCATYAAGVVCCADGEATVRTAEVRRGLFTAAPHATEVVTVAGTYTLCPVTSDEPDAPSLALQGKLAEVEVVAAISARDSLEPQLAGEDLLVVDGPLRGRQHLPRVLGFIKTHRADYLPPRLNGLVGSLAAGQRSPVFGMGTNWDRYAWYLRLPGGVGAPWAGVVRVECSAELSAEEAITLADLSQDTLCRYASAEFKDARAPQNLYPIGGLERALRRRLGDASLMYRALRTAAGGSP
jgi:hypothetical protein